MSAQIVFRGDIFDIRSGMTIRDALKKLEIPTESVLATRGGELITDDEILREGDKIKLVAVISGGS
jgi:sulfur carrier protein